MNASNQRHEIAIVDTSIAGYQSLIDAAGQKGMEIIRISGDGGMEQIAQKLEGRENIGALHLFSHGSEGQVYLGGDILSSDTLDEHNRALTAIKHSLSEEGDILLYGCDVAQGDGGQRFIEKLALLSSADVAASDDKTGVSGNWALESYAGQLEFEALEVTAFQSDLAVETFDGYNGGTSVGEFNVAGLSGDGATAYLSNTAADATFSLSSGNGFTFESIDISQFNPSFPADVTFTAGGFSQTVRVDSANPNITFQPMWTNVPQLTISVSGGDNPSLDNLTFTEIFPPTDISIDNTSVTQSSGTNAAIGNLGSVDSDSSSFTYSLVTGGGSGDNSLFNISSGALVATDALAMSGGNYNVRIQTSDEAGNTYQESFSITVVDDVSPTVTSIVPSGSPTASDTSVDFDVTFNESVDNVTIDDFSLATTGSAAGNIASVSGSGSTYTLTVDSITGEGTLRADLNGSTDVQDTGANLPGSYTSGAVHTVDRIAPTVSDTHIALSGASGTGDAFKVGDTVTATWDNTADGDNNSDTIDSVSMDFSGFGGGPAVAASNSGGIWTATYTVTENGGDSIIDGTDTNVSVTAIDDAGNPTTATDTTNATVDNDSPLITDGNLNITTTGTGSGGAFRVGDTVTTTWNDTATGDNNSDTISSVSVDFSGFGGGAAVAASNSGDTWTATYTITENGGAIIDGTNINVTITATDDAGNTAENTVSVTVNNINEAPSLTATGGNPVFIEGDVDANLFNATTADTEDNGQTFASLTLTVTNVVDGADEILRIDGSDLALTNGNSIISATNNLDVSASLAGSTATVSFSGANLSEAAMQTLMDDLAYLNTSENPTTGANRVVTITEIQDDGSAINTATPTLQSTVNLTPVNDAPTAANVAGDSQAMISGNGPQVTSLFDDAIVSDPENHIRGGMLTITQSAGNNGNWGLNNGTSGADNVFGNGETVIVSGVTIGTVTVSDGQNGNNLGIILDASVTEAQVSAFLADLTYDPTTSGTGVRAFALSLSDGDGTSNGGAESSTSGAFTITVTGSPPVISGLDGGLVTFTEESAPVRLDSDGNTSITDIDSSDFNGGTITASITGGGTSAEDKLKVVDSADGRLTVQNAGTELHWDDDNDNNTATVKVADIAGGSNGDDLVLTLTASARPGLGEAIEAILRNIAYENTNTETPSTANRILTVQVKDSSAAEAGVSALSTVTVGVTERNDAPTLTATSSNPTFTEGNSAAGLFSNTNIDTVETDDNIEQLVLKVAGLTDGADEKLSIDDETIVLTDGNTGTTVANGFAYSVNLNGKTATIILSENDTPARWQALMNGAGYLNTSDNPDTGARTVTVDSVTDTGGTGNGGDNTASLSLASSVTMIATNDAPVIAVNNAPSVLAGRTVTIATENLNEGDPDDDGDQLTYTLDALPTSGALSLNGVELAENDTFTQQDIDNDLLTFTAGGHGTASFDITLADGGENGASPVSETVSVNVTAPPPPSPGPQPAPEEEEDDVVIFPPGEEGADTPLHFQGNDGTQPVTVLTLPTGVGASARSNDTARTRTNEPELLNLIRNSAASETNDLNTLLNGGSRFIDDNGIGDLWINRLTLTREPGSNAAPAVRINGQQGDTSADFREAMVIDGRELGGGRIELNHIEFAVVVGNYLNISGGAGDNTVFAGAGNQILILGEGDDELHGGAGTDVVGSRGGDDRLLDRQGDLEGFQHWADQLEQTGNFTDVVQGFLYSGEFTRKLGQSIDTLNNGEQVDLLY